MRHLTGQETEPHEIRDPYFKVYKSQLPVIEEAFETTGLMLGTHKPRGYCRLLPGTHLTRKHEAK